MIIPYHPLHGVSQGQETILASSGDKQTHNWDTECSNQHLSQSTLRSKGLKSSKMKGRAIYTKLPRNARLFDKKVKLFLTKEIQISLKLD